ncbi:MAG: class I SAM-dependent methyltransferase [Caldilineaceae bacterium]|nr:class I SAM-dependent methyltransferase [Caldilineaceae bacterium]
METEKTTSWDIQTISDSGERVTHLNPDCVFYGHLSIYDFAKQFTNNGVVLDVGCGAGYGAAYLKAHGASLVYGIDYSEKAIAFDRFHFQDSGLEFRVMDATNITDFPERSFDLIFTSNTLEHIPNVSAFLYKAWQLLKPSGTLLIAVPPITNEHFEYHNVINPYHLNIWSPRQWHHTISQYFAEITPYLHGLEKIGLGYQPQHITGEHPLTPSSFIFEHGTIDMMYDTPTITSIFVVHAPRPANAIPGPGAAITYIDSSYSRAVGEISPAVRQRLLRYFEPKEARISLIFKTIRMLRNQGIIATLKESFRYMKYHWILLKKHIAL